jgi:hypothetical protein
MARFLAPEDLPGGSPPETPKVAVASLAPGARLLLWSLRYRVVLLRRQTEPDALLLDVLRSNRAEDLLGPLDRLVSLVGGLATRMVDVRCPACTTASADEIALLGAVADAARGDDAAADRRFSGMLTDTARRFAVAYVTGMARMLAHAGLPVAAPARTPAATILRAVRDGDRLVPLH